MHCIVSVQFFFKFININFQIILNLLRFMKKLIIQSLSFVFQRQEIKRILRNLFMHFIDLYFIHIYDSFNAIRFNILISYHSQINYKYQFQQLLNKTQYFFMKNFFLIFLFYLMINLISSILLKVEKNKIKCFSLELDSQKVMELKFKIKSTNQKCHIRLSVQLRTSYQQSEAFNNQILAKGFQCQQIQQQHFLQKFNDQHLTGISKYKVCLNTLIANQPILVQLILNEKINLKFHDRNQQLSLVTSIELGNLHDTIIKLSHQLVRMEFMQADFLKAQQQLTNSNIELKEDIKNVTIVQLIIISIMGVIWIMILRNGKI